MSAQIGVCLGQKNYLDKHVLYPKQIFGKQRDTEILLKRDKTVAGICREFEVLVPYYLKWVPFIGQSGDFQ